MLSRTLPRTKTLSKADIERRTAKADAARERQRQRQQARLNDPAFRASVQQKRADASQRSLERQRERLNDPAYREKVLHTQQLAQQRRQAKAAVRRPTKPTATGGTATRRRGMMGRTRSAEEKRIEALIASVGCICCRNKRWVTVTGSEGQHHISLHHVAGRTRAWAHAMQLPLCQYHHDTAPPEGAPAGLFPLHGSGRKVWERENGTQLALLEQLYDEIDETAPWQIETTT